MRQTKVLPKKQKVMFSEKLANIICKANMSTRASYYSGRGVNLGDLSEKELFKIYDGILEGFDKIAVEGFVNMVMNLSVLSASEFLEALEILEIQDWKWQVSSEKHVSAVPADKDNPAGTMIGLMLFMNDNTPKEEKVKSSNYLKRHFLKTKLPKETYAVWEKENLPKEYYA